jgi:hypothetical protein
MLGKAWSQQGNRHHKTTLNMEHFYYKNMSAIHQYSTLPQYIKQFSLSHCLYNPKIIHMVNIPQPHCSFNDNCNWEQVIVQKSCIKWTKLRKFQEVDSSITVTENHTVTISLLCWCIENWWHREALEPGYNHSKILWAIQKNILAAHVCVRQRQWERQKVVRLVYHYTQHAERK